MDTQADLNDLSRLLREERPGATVAFLPRASTDVTGELDAIARSVGFQPIGERWHEIDRDEAMRILARVLRFDLAYSSSEEMDETRANELAMRFVNRFSPPTRWFSNGHFTPWGWAGFGHLSNATCETGVAALSDELVGILWVEDED